MLQARVCATYMDGFLGQKFSLFDLHFADYVYICIYVSICHNKKFKSYYNTFKNKDTIRYINI